MAHQNLPLSSLAEFPQPYEGQLLDNLIRSVEFAEAGIRPVFCQHEIEGHKFGCGKVAIVTDIKSELAYCMGCFREVALG